MDVESKGMRKPLARAAAIAAILILAGISAWIKNRNDTYVSDVTINRPFDVAWVWLSEPSNYRRLYPNWIKEITPASGDAYKVNDRFGGSYIVTVIRSKEFGIVDLHIGTETSRLRLIPLSAEKTLAVHVATRWTAANALAWFFHKRTTDQDLENAKMIIEAE